MGCAEKHICRHVPRIDCQQLDRPLPDVAEQHEAKKGAEHGEAGGASGKRMRRDLKVLEAHAVPHLHGEQCTCAHRHAFDDELNCNLLCGPLPA